MRIGFNETVPTVKMADMDYDCWEEGNIIVDEAFFLLMIVLDETVPTGKIMNMNYGEWDIEDEDYSTRSTTRMRKRVNQ